MRVTREQAAVHREKILDAAGTLFRERGYDGIGLADIMKRAGLTHGGFYGHFGFVGALMLSRGVDDPELSDEILEAAAATLVRS